MIQVRGSLGIYMMTKQTFEENYEKVECCHPCDCGVVGR